MTYTKSSAGFRFQHIVLSGWFTNKTKKNSRSQSVLRIAAAYIKNNGYIRGFWLFWPSVNLCADVDKVGAKTSIPSQIKWLPSAFSLHLNVPFRLFVNIVPLGFGLWHLDLYSFVSVHYVFTDVIFFLFRCQMLLSSVLIRKTLTLWHSIVVRAGESQASHAQSSLPRIRSRRNTGRPPQQR